MKKSILLSIILLISILSYSQIIEELGAWEYGPTEAIAVKDSTAYISSGSYLWVLDISDESNPTLMNEEYIGKYITYLNVVGNYLFLSKEDSILNIYDVHTLYYPTLSNQYHESTGTRWWRDMFIEDDTVYICGRYNYQYLINDTVNLTYIRRAGFGYGYDKEDTLGASYQNEYISVFNISGTSDVNTFTDFYTATEDTRGVALKFPYVYFGYGSKGIGVLDINNLYNIIEKSNYITNGYTYDIELIEDTILIAARGFNGIGIYDIDDDTIFTLIGECDTDGYAFELEVIGDRLYVGARSGGLQIINISNKTNPTLIGEFRGYGECRRIDIEGDRLYVASGDGGLTIMDITTRTDPIVISQCYSRHIAEDVVKQGNYIYIADGDSGLTIFDITDENDPSIEGSCESGGYAYYAGVYDNTCIIGGSKSTNRGIGVIDVSVKTNPILANELMDNWDDIRFSLVDSILHCVSTPTPNPRYELWNVLDAYNPIAGDSYIENLGMNYSVTANQTLSVVNYHDSLFYFDVSNPSSITKEKVMNTPYTDEMEIYDDYLYILTGQPWIYIYDLILFPTVDTVQIIELDEWARDINALTDYFYLTHDKFGLSIFGEQTGIEKKQIFTKQDNITITTTFNSISINNQTGIPQQYQLMDITGRIVNTIEAKSGITVITPKRSGVYFIMSKDKLMKKKFIVIR